MHSVPETLNPDWRLLACYCMQSSTAEPLTGSYCCSTCNYLIWSAGGAGPLLLYLAHLTRHSFLPWGCCCLCCRCLCYFSLAPQVFTKLLLTCLPHELGKFVIDSSAAASNSGGSWLSGEISLVGSSAASLSANLALSSDDVPKGRADVKDFAKVCRYLFIMEISLLILSPCLQHAYHAEQYAAGLVVKPLHHASSFMLHDIMYAVCWT